MIVSMKIVKYADLLHLITPDNSYYIWIIYLLFLTLAGRHRASQSRRAAYPFCNTLALGWALSPTLPYTMVATISFLVTPQSQKTVAILFCSTRPDSRTIPRKSE